MGNIMMSRKVLIVLVLFSIALSQAKEEAPEVEEGKEVQKGEELNKEVQKQKGKEAQEQKEKELQKQKEKEAQELKEKELQKQKEKEEQKNANCCTKDVLVTCDGINDGSKKEGETESPCVGFHSWTVHENIFGCYKKDQEKHEGRIWPFTSTAYEGSTQKHVTITKQE